MMKLYGKEPPTLCALLQSLGHVHAMRFNVVVTQHYAVIEFLMFTESMRDTPDVFSLPRAPPNEINT